MKNTFHRPHESRSSGLAVRLWQVKGLSNQKRLLPFVMSCRLNPTFLQKYKKYVARVEIGDKTHRGNGVRQTFVSTSWIQRCRPLMGNTLPDFTDATGDVLNRSSTIAFVQSFLCGESLPNSFLVTSFHCVLCDPW